MTRRKERIDVRYHKHRLEHPDAIAWDMVIHKLINGDEFNRPYKVWQWSRLMKVNKNTVIQWLPLINSYIRENGILSESVADAIVSSNITKQKG